MLRALICIIQKCLHLLADWRREPTGAEMQQLAPRTDRYILNYFSHIVLRENIRHWWARCNELEVCFGLGGKDEAVEDQAFWIGVRCGTIGI
jgi:hypothetical protein